MFIDVILRHVQECHMHHLFMAQNRRIDITALHVYQYRMDHLFMARDRPPMMPIIL